MNGPNKNYQKAELAIRSKKWTVEIPKAENGTVIFVAFPGLNGTVRSHQSG